MNTRIENLRDWLNRTMFSMSPKKRRLLRVIKRNAAALNPAEEIVRADLADIKDDCNDPRTLTLIAAHSDTWRSLTIMQLLDAAKPYPGKGEITHLTESHFAIYNEMAALERDKEDSLSSYLSPEAFTVRRQGAVILAYALHNTGDWCMIVSLLRDRDMWDYDTMSEALSSMKSVGNPVLANGAL